MSIFKNICDVCKLGEIINEPERLTGGYMHKMYSLFTRKGRYAVKLLDPYIMRRDTAMDNFRTAEGFEKVLEYNGIPILPALTFDGSKMQCIDGQYFYVYEFFRGKALKDGEITAQHCRRIGKVLAQIHALDRKPEGNTPYSFDTDWDGYIEQLSECDTELCGLLKNNRELLYESMRRGNEAAKVMPTDMCICHNDMDSKNVLWHNGDFRIIDLECLGYSSPIAEAYELALCWSGYEECDIDFTLFEEFIRAYIEAGGSMNCESDILYYSNFGRLEWLEYNVKKSLGIECDEADTASAKAQVRETVAHVIYYDKAKEDIVKRLDKLL